MRASVVRFTRRAKGRLKPPESTSTTSSGRVSSSAAGESPPGADDPAELGNQLDDPADRELALIDDDLDACRSHLRSAQPDETRAGQPRPHRRRRAPPHGPRPERSPADSRIVTTARSRLARAAIRGSPREPAPPSRRAATPARPSFSGGLRVCDRLDEARATAGRADRGRRAKSPRRVLRREQVHAAASRAALDFEPAFAPPVDHGSLRARTTQPDRKRSRASASSRAPAATAAAASPRGLHLPAERRGSPNRDRGASGPARRRCRGRAREAGCRRRTRILRGAPGAREGVAPARVVPLDVSDLQDPPERLGAQRPAACPPQPCSGEGLLDEHVEPCLDERECRLDVGRGRHGHDRRVHVAQSAQIVDGRDAYSRASGSARAAWRSTIAASTQSRSLAELRDTVRACSRPIGPAPTTATRRRVTTRPDPARTRRRRSRRCSARRPASPRARESASRRPRRRGSWPAPRPSQRSYRAPLRADRSGDPVPASRPSRRWPGACRAAPGPADRLVGPLDGFDGDDAAALHDDALADPRRRRVASSARRPTARSACSGGSGGRFDQGPFPGDRAIASTTSWRADREALSLEPVARGPRRARRPSSPRAPASSVAAARSGSTRPDPSNRTCFGNRAHEQDRARPPSSAANRAAASSWPSLCQRSSVDLVGERCVGQPSNAMAQPPDMPDSRMRARRLARQAPASGDHSEAGDRVASSSQPMNASATESALGLSQERDESLHLGHCPDLRIDAGERLLEAQLRLEDQVEGVLDLGAGLGREAPPVQAHRVEPDKSSPGRPRPSRRAPRRGRASPRRRPSPIRRRARTDGAPCTPPTRRNPRPSSDRPIRRSSRRSRGCRSGSRDRCGHCSSGRRLRRCACSRRRASSRRGP